MFTEATVQSVSSYIAEGGKRDALGHFIEWLHTRAPLYGYVFKGAWFDIGNIEVYKRADEYFTSRAKGARMTNGGY
jgi:glucose-1-phosphate thymidylyltransferase